MKVTPLHKYDEPRFPTRAILDEHPELLRLVPERWQRNPVVLSALAGLCLLVLSARDLSADPVKKTAPRIAPVFQHGDGRGAFGCEAINPPVFLSEDEARQVIIEEGKRAGITFTPSNQTLNNIKIKGANPDYSRIDDFNPVKVSSTTRTIPLELDGIDVKRNISFEYVSERDIDEIMGEPIYTSTVYTVETINAAKKLREGIRTAKPAGAYAVFYDPMSNPPSNWMMSGSQADWEKKQAEGYLEAVETSRKQLRKQVKSFIIWLKTQGVI